MTVQNLVTYVGSGLAVIFASGLVSAIVSTLHNRWVENRRALDAERARLLQHFSEAFTVVSAYKEFPYTIRRRRIDLPEAERARISAELSLVQSRLSYYEAWTYFESPRIGQSYARLVSALRATVGVAMREAWKIPGASSDEEMNTPAGTLDLSQLHDPEQEYLAAVTHRIDQLTPRKLRRAPRLGAKKRKLAHSDNQRRIPPTQDINT